jgi:hypothetical protein
MQLRSGYLKINELQTNIKNGKEEQIIHEAIDVVCLYRRMKGYTLCPNVVVFNACMEKLVQLFPTAWYEIDQTAPNFQELVKKRLMDESYHYKCMQDHAYHFICDVYNTICRRTEEKLVISAKMLWECYAINGYCCSSYADQYMKKRDDQSFLQEVLNGLYVDFEEVLEVMAGEEEFWHGEPSKVLPIKGRRITGTSFFELSSKSS